MFSGKGDFAGYEVLVHFAFTSQWGYLALWTKHKSDWCFRGLEVEVEERATGSPRATRETAGSPGQVVHCPVIWSSVFSADVKKNIRIDNFTVLVF